MSKRVGDPTKDKKKKKKKKEKLYVMLNVDEDDANFPLEYSTGTSSWTKLRDDIQEICELQSHQFSLFYLQEFGTKSFKTHLTEKSFDAFNAYIKKQEGKGPISINIQTTQTKPLILTGTTESKASNKQNNINDHPISIEEPSSSRKVTVDDIIAGIEEKYWDKSYVLTFSSSERAKILRKFVSSALEKIDCTDCHTKHQRKKLSAKCLDKNKIKTLFTSQEVRLLIEKRSVFESIYGNGDLLLNSLYCQCPICGTVISIGHYNDVCQKKDHLYQHMRAAHYEDPVRSSFRVLGYICIQRHQNYLNNNFNCEIPKGERCKDGGLHKFENVEIPGSRKSPWDNTPVKLEGPNIPENIICKVNHNETENVAVEMNDIEFQADPFSISRLKKHEYVGYAEQVFPHISVCPNNMKLLIKPNAELKILDNHDAAENGILMSQKHMHPALIRLQELIDSGLFTESHPFFQELHMFSTMYGNTSTDPARGFTNIQSRYPGLMYLQERMRDAASGRAAYNLYLGRHSIGSGKKLCSKAEILIPNPQSVFHFGLSPKTWLKKATCPALFDGILVQFLIVLLEIVPLVTKVKIENAVALTTYAAIIFDQKAISPGAELYDGIIHGVIPKLNTNDVTLLCENGYMSMLKLLIEKFQTKVFRWVKEVEVFMIQFLDILVAVPVACYDLEMTGESEDVRERVTEVLLYANSCYHCLKDSMETGLPPKCVVDCLTCFQSRKVCEKHEDSYDDWIPDQRQCSRCLQLKLKCTRFKIISTISDMDPSYEKYGKSVSKTFEESLRNSESNTYHLHDIGHNIKNAEAALERGTHFDGKSSYDSSDIAVLMASTDGEDYKNLNAGVSHRAVLQFDKQSDELSLQRISSNVTDACVKAESLLKTDIPEIRRPWFSEDHEKFDMLLFVAVSKCGLVFATDDCKQVLLYYRQSSLPRKINFVGRKDETNTNDDLLLQKVTATSEITWKSIAGITFFRSEKVIIVADIGFKSLRILQGTKTVRRQVDAPMFQPINNLRRLPNMKLSVHSIKVQNRPDLAPCGLSEVNENLLAIADPVHQAIEIVEISEDFMSCISLKSIKSPLFSKLFDCVLITPDIIAVTDVSGAQKQLHIVDINNETVEQTLGDTISPSGLCVMDNLLLISDTDAHCIYSYKWQSKELNLFIGKIGENGFEDGPALESKLTSPIGLASRGSTLFIAEHPENYQGSIKVFSSLNGLVNFKSTWRNIARCFGMISKRESNYLLKKAPERIPKSLCCLEARTVLPNYASDLQTIIESIRMIHSTERLDITFGSMSSQTAEAVFRTLVNGICFINSCFSYIGENEMLKLIKLKCLTTRLIECFFGHMTAGVQGNNLKYMEIKRKITNDAFTFLLPFVNSSDSGVSVRSEKDRVVETYSYSQDSVTIENTALIWEFQAIKREKLLTVHRKGELKKFNKENPGNLKKGNFCFGRKMSNHDYMVQIGVDDEIPILKSCIREVTTALKSRPMRRLRGFSKRRFGTAPTILGVHAKRREVNLEEGALTFIERIDGNVQDMQLVVDLFQAGEFVVFRSTDELPFNIIQITNPCNLNTMQQQSKIKGNFIVPTVNATCFDNEDEVSFFSDPNWRGGSMPFKDVLRDSDSQIVTVTMNLKVDPSSEDHIYTLSKSVFNEIEEISFEYELNVVNANVDIEVENNDYEAEEGNETLNDDGDDEENVQEEEQQVILNPRLRKSRGNRYASVIGTLL